MRQPLAQTDSMRRKKRKIVDKYLDDEQRWKRVRELANVFKLGETGWAVAGAQRIAVGSVKIEDMLRIAMPWPIAMDSIVCRCSIDYTTCIVNTRQVLSQWTTKPLKDNIKGAAVEAIKIKMIHFR